MGLASTAPFFLLELDRSLFELDQAQHQRLDETHPESLVERRQVGRDQLAHERCVGRTRRVERAAGEPPSDQGEAAHGTSST